MSMTYQQFILRLAQNLGPAGETVNWAAVIPEIIDAAEQRIYRDLNLLATIVRDSSTSTTANTRDFTLPVPASGRFTVVSRINVISPAATAPTAGTRNPMIRVAPALVDFLATTEASGTAIPTMFGMVTDQSLIFGPCPDAAYRVEVVGTVRPTPLSSSNTSTFLTNYLPDLFLAAALAFMASNHKALMPDMPDVDAQYAQLLASADAEEVRRRYNLSTNTPITTGSAKTSQIGQAAT